MFFHILIQEKVIIIKRKCTKNSEGPLKQKLVTIYIHTYSRTLTDSSLYENIFQLSDKSIRELLHLDGGRTMPDFPIAENNTNKNEVFLDYTRYNYNRAFNKVNAGRMLACLIRTGELYLKRARNSRVFPMASIQHLVYREQCYQFVQRQEPRSSAKENHLTKIPRSLSYERIFGDIQR